MSVHHKSSFVTSCVVNRFGHVKESQSVAAASLFVHCQVQDFLQRVGGGRFPSIEKDMQMVQAHCGSLFLDPAELAKVTYR